MKRKFLVLLLAGLLPLVSHAFRDASDDELVDAAARGELAALKVMLTGLHSVNQRASNGETLLDAAVRSGNSEEVRYLLQRGARPDDPGALGLNPLGSAAQAGYATAVRDLVAAGADLERKSRPGNTPLHEAVRVGRMPMVSQLLALGADPYACDEEGRTALGLAVDLHQEAVMLGLVARQVDPGRLRCPPAVSGNAVVGVR